MEVLEYVDKLSRMRMSFGGGCKRCPLRGKACDTIYAITEETVQLVEQWDKDNPEEVK